MFIGTLAPHITTEVDCESLFLTRLRLDMLPIQTVTGQRTVAETFERLEMTKHCLSSIYCCPVKVKLEFLDRWRKKAWSEKEDRDDIAFWEQQKKEYLEVNPTHRQMIAELEAEVDAAADDDDAMEDVL